MAIIPTGFKFSVVAKKDFAETEEEEKIVRSDSLYINQHGQRCTRIVL